MIGKINNLWAKIWATNHHRIRWFWVASIIGLIAPWGCEWLDLSTLSDSQDCTVSSIYDGDTLRAQCGGEKVKVRFYCIDAPEMKQRPWGRESRDYLRSIAPKAVQLQVKTTDRYGRKVADVIADGESLNLAMVRNGYAAVYPKYCKDSAYYRAQDSARGAGLGIWSKPGLQQTPWEYRHR